MNVHHSISEAPENFAVIRAGSVSMASVQKKPNLRGCALTKSGNFFRRLD
jgi:hypothetical protein